MQQTPSPQTLATVVLTLEPYSSPALKATVTLQRTSSRHCAATMRFEGSQKHAEFGFLRWSTVPWRLYLKAAHMVLTRAHLHQWNLASVALFRQASIEVFQEVGESDPRVSVVMVDLAEMRAVFLDGYPEVARAEYSIPQRLLLQSVVDMLNETVCTLTQTPRKPRPKPS